MVGSSFIMLEMVLLALFNCRQALLGAKNHIEMTVYELLTILRLECKVNGPIIYIQESILNFS